jgi:hypothetical protein
MYEEIEIMPQPEEGIEQDGFFHQHGTQLYNGGYGLDNAMAVLSAEPTPRQKELQAFAARLAGSRASRMPTGGNRAGSSMTVEVL